MDAQITEGTFQQAQLSAALLTFLHGLKTVDCGAVSAVTITATLGPGGELEADLHVVNAATGEQWGASL